MTKIGYAFVSILILLFGLSRSEAQQPTRVPRIGILIPEAGLDESQTVKGFRDGLKEAGYKEGDNILVEVEDAKGAREQLQRAINELLSKKVDVILTTGTRATRAAMATTKQIPIVFRHPADPVTLGLVKDVNRPGGNVTGVAAFSLDANQKRLEVFQQLFPKLRRIHIFYDANNRFSPDNFAAAEKSAARLKLDVLEHSVKTAEELKSSLHQLEVKPGDAIFQIADDLVESQAPVLLEEAKKRKMATMFPEEVWASRGSLAGYGPNYYEMGRQTADLVQKILKGSHPKDLAVAHANKFDLAINLRTASSIGLKIPPELLKKADKVIR
ncbi:MAG TPA: ABC transporter substrate-binding protein [Candidatus Polarisedimenticolaceae bacterium]|nr:ABC transporter substrate-binding protein [Candidatus Polarisedimenticolaceae bacterium]